MTHTELAQETLDYYTNNPRGLNKLGQCVYLTEVKTKCAVGRCLNEESPHYKEIIEKYNWGTAPDFLLEKFGKDILLPQYQNINVRFFGILQIFHDKYYHWNPNNTLTENGKEEYKNVLALAKIFDDRQKGKK